MRALIGSTLLLALAALVSCAHDEERPHADAHHADAAPTAGHACGGGGGGMMGVPDASGAMVTMAGPASTTALPPGVNAVQNEMRLLNRAMHQSMTSLALGELDKIPPLFHAVHMAKGLTEKAIADGSWKPAKGDVAAFVALDTAFHGEIEKLVHAATAKDTDGVANQLHTMTKGCIGCHAAFRVPPAP